MIIINFKNYVSGEKALKLARVIEKYLPSAVVAVNDFDVDLVARKTKLKVFVQHMDYFRTERATGFVIPEIVRKSGAVGSLLNHSEHRLRDETIEKTIKRANEAGLGIVVCAESVKRAKRFLKFGADAIAFEDLDLVASGKSITEFREKDVRNFARLFKGRKIIPLCGAGIHSVEDVVRAYELGCKGVLISSAIANVPLKKAEKLLREIREINLF